MDLKVLFLDSDHTISSKLKSIVYSQNEMWKRVLKVKKKIYPGKEWVLPIPVCSNALTVPARRRCPAWACPWCTSDVSRRERDVSDLARTCTNRRRAICRPPVKNKKYSLLPRSWHMTEYFFLFVWLPQESNLTLSSYSSLYILTTDPTGTDESNSYFFLIDKGFLSRGKINSNG